MTKLLIATILTAFGFGLIMIAAAIVVSGKTSDPAIAALGIPLSAVVISIGGMAIVGLILVMALGFGKIT